MLAQLQALSLPLSIIGLIISAYIPIYIVCANSGVCKLLRERRVAPPITYSTKQGMRCVDYEHIDNKVGS